MNVARPEQSLSNDDLRAVEPGRRADVAIDTISIARRTWSRSNRRPGALAPREALIALEYEGLIVAVAACNVAHGVVLSAEDLQRLLLAYERIYAVVAEV